MSGVLWYLEDRLLDGVAAVTDEVERAFEAVFGERVDFRPPIRVGSWVGGDRDGNPFVTPEVTVKAARRGAWVAIGRYLALVRDLVHRLSLSSRVKAPTAGLVAWIEAQKAELPDVWEANRRRDEDEPIRLALSFVAARLERARTRLVHLENGDPTPVAQAYVSPEALIADLGVVREAVVAGGAPNAARDLVDPLIDRVVAFGFAGAALDVREDAGAHKAALDAIAAAVGLEAFDRERLAAELVGRRPLVAARVELPEAAAGTLAIFEAVRRIQAELGEGAARTYIASMTRGADDMLRILLLGREAGLVDLAADPPRSTIDVVPLFETLADLEAGPGIVDDLLGDPVYRRQLAARAAVHGGPLQEVMLGYSDSAKGAGVLPAAWALYRAQERLAAIARRHGVALVLFHGQGGTVGRGGGSPVYRALTALPPFEGRIKITEQGEVISQKFGLGPIAERSLEVLVVGALMATLTPTEADARFREVMDRLAALALPAYRSRVHESDALFEMFLGCTPVRDLGMVHFGSRPAYRQQGKGTMAGIRAIPWTFGWTQMRLNLSSWLGVGTALATVAAEGGLPTLQEMAVKWPFFDDLLGKIEMVCAKADLEVARLYVDRLGGDVALFEELVAEFDRTVETILAIRGEKYLVGDNPVLQASIVLRNPYVDPLSLLQVRLLAERRAGVEGLDRALASTLNGVAQGLRNTG